MVYLLLLLENIILGKKNNKKHNIKINLKTLEDMPYQLLESLPCYSIVDDCDVYNYLYPFNYTKYDTLVDDSEFRELLLDVHGFILSQPIFKLNTYLLFEKITEKRIF